MLDYAKRSLNQITHRIYSLPVVVLMVEAGCNCRCAMCDIWLLGGSARQLSIELLSRQLEDMRRLHVQSVVLSGGEPLLHPDLLGGL